MSAKRIIPALKVKDGRVAGRDRFGGSRDLGHPAEMACRFELEGADALLFQVREASPQGSWISEVAHALSIPFMVEGGIRTLEAAEGWLGAGADAVVLDRAIMATPSAVRRASLRYGSAAVLVSADGHPAAEPRNPEPHEAGAWLGWLWDAVELGVGGILLRSLERDGTRGGFDLERLQEAVRLPVPVLAAGGAGCADHVLEALEFGAEGTVLGTLFQDLRASVADLKSFLAERGITLRR